MLTPYCLPLAEQYNKCACRNPARPCGVPRPALSLRRAAAILLILQQLHNGVDDAACTAATPCPRPSWSQHHRLQQAVHRPSQLLHQHLYDMTPCCDDRAATNQVSLSLLLQQLLMLPLPLPLPRRSHMVTQEHANPGTAGTVRTSSDPEICSAGILLGLTCEKPGRERCFAPGAFKVVIRCTACTHCACYAGQQQGLLAIHSTAS